MKDPPEVILRVGNSGNERYANLDFVRGNSSRIRQDMPVRHACPSTVPVFVNELQIVEHQVGELNKPLQTVPIARAAGFNSRVDAQKPATLQDGSGERNLVCHLTARQRDSAVGVIEEGLQARCSRDDMGRRNPLALDSQSSGWASPGALAAGKTLVSIHQMTGAFYPVDPVGADDYAPTARGATVSYEDKLRPGALRFRAMTPPAGKRAAFQIHSQPNARAVVASKRIGIEY